MVEPGAHRRATVAEVGDHPLQRVQAPWRSGCGMGTYAANAALLRSSSRGLRLISSAWRDAGS